MFLQFCVKTQIPERVQYHVQPSIASNGKHMYILLGKSLFKIGTGFNGTLKGYVYGVNPEFCKEKNGWIGFCGVRLFFLYFLVIFDLLDLFSHIFLNIHRILYSIRKFRNAAMKLY